MTLINNNCSLNLFGDRNPYIELFKNINSKNTSNSRNSIKIDNESNQMKISTKYYETEISLNYIDSDLSKIDKDSAYDGLLVYLSETNRNLNQLHLEDCLKEKHLKLIILENLNSFTNKNEINSFTDEHDFTLIDLSTADEDENGIDELINSLYVHEWSIMNKVKLIDAEKEEKTSASSSSKEKDSPEEFENILLNLQDFRLKASQMEPNQRKTFAQEIVTKFWNSIGGDDEELDGLSDLSDMD